MGTEQNGLATVEQIEALADQLSACADEIHARVMKDIKAHKGGDISEAEQTVARALLDDEVVLRQRANGLYADAATYVVKALGKPQQHVLELTAAATGQAAPILLALEIIRLQSLVVKADFPKKPG